LRNTVQFIQEKQNKKKTNKKQQLKMFPLGSQRTNKKTSTIKPIF